jgi:hypothetical protein
MAIGLSIKGGVRQTKRAEADAGADGIQANANSTESVNVPADGTCAASSRQRRLWYVTVLRAALGQVTACLCIDMGMRGMKRNSEARIKRRAKHRVSLRRLTVTVFRQQSKTGGEFSFLTAVHTAQDSGSGFP